MCVVGFVGAVRDSVGRLHRDVAVDDAHQRRWRGLEHRAGGETNGKKGLDLRLEQRQKNPSQYLSS